jgi:hypothetical protein
MVLFGGYLIEMGASPHYHLGNRRIPAQTDDAGMLTSGTLPLHIQPDEVDGVSGEDRSTL